MPETSKLFSLVYSKFHTENLRNIFIYIWETFPAWDGEQKFSLHVQLFIAQSKVFNAFIPTQQTSVNCSIAHFDFRSKFIIFGEYFEIFSCKSVCDLFLCFGQKNLFKCFRCFQCFYKNYLVKHWNNMLRMFL